MLWLPRRIKNNMYSESRTWKTWKMFSSKCLVGRYQEVVKRSGNPPGPPRSLILPLLLKPWQSGRTFSLFLFCHILVSWHYPLPDLRITEV